MSDCLQHHVLHHARLSCPLLSPGVCSNSCPSSQRYHPNISSSVTPFSTSPQSFPGIWVFSNVSALSGQSIGASASASVLPMNIHSWFLLGLTGLISLLSNRLKSLLQHHISKALILQGSVFFMGQLAYLYMTIGKTIAFTRRTLWTKWCLCFLIRCLGLS